MTQLFRPALPEDIPALVDIECRAFNRDTDDGRAHKRFELTRELKDYVVLLVDDEPVACARIQRQWLRVGRCEILHGDLGHVAVKPELHGQGLGTTLMRAVIPHMRETGIHYSRLGGLMKFYSRFGYEPFFRRYVHIPVPRLDSALKGQKWGEMLALAPEQAACVRPVHPAQDYAAIHRLRYQFNKRRSAAPVMSPEPHGARQGEPDPEGLEWVYDRDGIRGYLRAALGLVNAGDPQPSYRIDDLAFDPGCPQAVGALVKTLICRAQDRAPTVISCRLPYDEALLAALVAGGIGCETVETRHMHDGNMIRLVNLAGLLEAIAPELSARVELDRLPWEGSVRLVTPHETAVLRIASGLVQVAVEGGDVTVKASQRDVLQWVYGIAGFGEFPQAAALTLPERATLSLLFPRTPCFSGPWG